MEFWDFVYEGIVKAEPVISMLVLFSQITVLFVINNLKINVQTKVDNSVRFNGYEESKKIKQKPSNNKE